MVLDRRIKQCFMSYVHVTKPNIEKFANKDTWVVEKTQSMEQHSEVEQSS